MSSDNIIILLLVVFVIVIVIVVVITKTNKNKIDTVNTADYNTINNTNEFEVENKKEFEVENKKEFEVENKKEFEVENKKEVKDVFTNPSLPQPLDVYKSTQKGIDSILLDTAKNPIFYGVVAADIALMTILRASLDKVFRKNLVNSVKIIGLKAGFFATQVLAKIGVKSAVKLGTGLGTKLAAKATIAVSSGPGAPFVAAGLAASEILSIGLDLTDSLVPGGTVGYAKMGTNEAYYAIRDETTKQINEALKEADAPSPLIIGPLGNIDGEAFVDLMTQQIDLIMSEQPTNILLKPMISTMLNDLKAGIVSLEDTKDEKKMEKYSELIDQIALTKEAYSRLCLKYNGKYVVNSKGENSCSFPDKKTCDSSYSWPLKDTDMYAEFKNGTCNLASSHLKTICDSNKIPYNSDKSSCDITEDYCKTKGADWGFNDKIKENDCTINASQNFFEMLLGSTVTRGLKQIFDPAQYEKCKTGEVDDGYFCRTKKCKDGHESQGADQLCYPKCPNNYNGIGPVCWEKCPDGFVDDGAFCRKPIETITKKTYVAKLGDCPPGSNANTFGDCIAPHVDRQDGVNWAETIGSHPDKSDGCSWNRHVEAAMCFRACPSGYFGRAHARCALNGANSDGVTKKFTERGLGCGNGYRNIAGVCWEDCPSGFVDTGAFCSKGGEVITKKTSTRGVGYIPETTVRVKQRAVDYSTRDN